MTSPVQVVKMPKSRKLEEAFKALDAYTTQAESGVLDTVLAKHVGVTRTAVKKWRASRGIHRPRGPRSASAQTATAIRLLGSPITPDPLHRTMTSVVGGQWSPPEFLLRQPIDYTQFARLSRSLLDQGYRIHEISMAFGFGEQDIETATTIHLDRHPRRKTSDAPARGSLTPTTPTTSQASESGVRGPG